MGPDNEDDMEMSMSSLLSEGETTPEDEATEKGRLWNSMSAIEADLRRPSQFLPLRPSGKSKMHSQASTLSPISPKVRAHNRPDDWLSSGRRNMRRSWKPKIVLEDDTQGEDTSDSGVGSGHNSFQSSRGHESLPTIPGIYRKGNSRKVPIVVQQKEWASPTTEKPKLRLNSSSIHSISTDDSQSQMSDRSMQLDNAPDLDDSNDGVGFERGQASSSKPGLLDVAMEKMEASMTSFAIEDDVETASTTKSAINMWNSMSAINTTQSLHADAQSRASRGSKVKWSFKDLENKNKAPAPLNESESSDESKSKPQERYPINEKTPKKNSPELEGSVTSFASNASAEPTDSPDNVISKFSMSMSCIDSQKPDEFLPLRPKYRAKKTSAIQHKLVAHNRPDDWVGPYAGSKPRKRSWTAKKVVEVSDMGGDDNSGDEQEVADVST
jgi:hypothetical protein